MIEPSPGSDKALAGGCRCPVLDNAHGRGYFAGTGFVIVEDCPLHGKDFRAAAHEAELDRLAEEASDEVSPG